MNDLKNYFLFLYDVNLIIMHVGNSPIVKAYALSDGLGQCVQLDKVNYEKDLGSGLPMIYS